MLFSGQWEDLLSREPRRDAGVERLPSASLGISFHVKLKQTFLLTFPATSNLGFCMQEHFTYVGLYRQGQDSTRAEVGEKNLS